MFEVVKNFQYHNLKKTKIKSHYSKSPKNFFWLHLVDLKINKK